MSGDCTSGDDEWPEPATRTVLERIAASSTKARIASALAGHTHVLGVKRRLPDQLTNSSAE
jgi:hypothetical protein